MNFLNEDVQTQILWKNLRPVVLGKITYAPDIPSVRKIIEKVRQYNNSCMYLVYALKGGVGMFFNLFVFDVQMN